MKKRFAAMFIAMFSLVILMTVSVSAVNTADVTIYGTQNYGAANDVLALVNSERAAAGLPALKMEPTLVANAMQRAAEISVYFSHTRPNGSECYTAFGSGFQSGTRGENIAWGQSTSIAVMDSWMNSEGHRANILNSKYTSIGIGCFYQDNGSRCWVQLFSSTRSSSTYNQSGTKSVSNIPVSIAQENLRIGVSGRNDCGEFEGYAGVPVPVQIRLYNQKTSGYVNMDSGCTMSVADSTIAKVQNNALMGLKAGSSTVRVQFAGAAGLYTDIPLKVYAKPVLKGSVNASGAHVLSWNDDIGKAYLFGKRADSDMWSLLAYPSASGYTNYNIYDAEAWTYVLRIKDSSGYTDVGDKLTLGGLSAPTVKASNVASSGKIKLSWNAVSGAAKYQVYRATSKDGTYSLLYTTTGTSMVNTSTTAGKTYYYKVQAVNAAGTKSDFSEIVSRTCDLPRPVISVSNKESTGKIVIKWDAVSGAKEYQVYRATSKNGTYSLLKTTTGTSLVNTSTTAGKTYYYKVKAICSVSGGNSAFSEIKSRTCDLPQPVVSVSNNASTGKIVIKWNAIDGAKEYQVYRATSKNGTYTLLKTMTGTTLTNTSTTAGKTYYYKVKAICSVSSGNSAFSEAKSRTCDLPRPVVKVSLNSSGDPVLTWDAVDGRKNYQVYRATSKSGTYSLLKTVSSTKTTDSSVTAGKTYYYKVKAIASVAAADSAPSTVVYVTAK